MDTRVKRNLKVLVFNANGIGRQRYELGKQLQDYRIDVCLLSQTHVQPQETFFIPNFHVCRTDHFPTLKGGTVVEVRKGMPHNHVDPSALVSV